MTTTSHRFFDGIPSIQATARSVPMPAKTKPTRPAPAMPASLWRHAQNEDGAEANHHRTAGWMLVGAAILIVGSVVYAICQTGALMSGGSLHDAVAAFLR